MLRQRLAGYRAASVITAIEDAAFLRRLSSQEAFGIFLDLYQAGASHSADRFLAEKEIRDIAAMASKLAKIRRAEKARN